MKGGIGLVQACHVHSYPLSFQLCASSITGIGSTWHSSEEIKVSALCKLVNYLYRLAGVAAVVGEDGRDGLQDFAGVSPGHHQTEEAGAGQGGDGLSRRVVGPRAADRGLQQQLEEGVWGREECTGVLSTVPSLGCNNTSLKRLKRHKRAEPYPAHREAPSESPQAAVPAACPAKPAGSAGTARGERSESLLSAQTPHTGRCR